MSCHLTKYCFIFIWLFRSTFPIKLFCFNLINLNRFWNILFIVVCFKKIYCFLQKSVNNKIITELIQSRFKKTNEPLRNIWVCFSQLIKVWDFTTLHPINVNDYTLYKRQDAKQEMKNLLMVLSQFFHFIINFSAHLYFFFLKLLF